MQQAHNLKVIGSNPTPATRFIEQYQLISPPSAGFSICAEPFPAMTKENRLTPMSWTKSDADDDGAQKIPWHKTGTKWHKIFDQLSDLCSLLGRGSTSSVRRLVWHR
jgi:hypothetical protein